MAYPEQLPAGRLAWVAKHRADTQSLPELAQSAQNCGLGELAAQGFPRLGGREHALFVQRLPQLQHQRRNLVAGGFLRSMLPIGIGPQAKHIRQRLACGPENPAAHSPPPSRFNATTVPEAISRVSHPCACSIAAASGSRLRAPHAGFDKRRRRRRQLRPPRQIQAQGMLCSQLSASSRVRMGVCFWRQCAARAAWSCSAVKVIPRFPSWESSRCDEMPAGFLSKHTAGRWDGHAGNWSGARFWPARRAAIPCARDRAECSL